MKPTKVCKYCLPTLDMGGAEHEACDIHLWQDNLSMSWWDFNFMNIGFCFLDKRYDITMNKITAFYRYSSTPGELEKLCKMKDVHSKYGETALDGVDRIPSSQHEERLKKEDEIKSRIGNFQEVQEKKEDQHVKKVVPSYIDYLNKIKNGTTE